MAETEAPPPEVRLTDRDLLIRIDERTKNIQRTVDGIPQTYVHKDDFAPVKKVVYGFVGLILIAVASLGISLALK